MAIFYATLILFFDYFVEVGQLNVFRSRYYLLIEYQKGLLTNICSVSATCGATKFMFSLVMYVTNIHFYTNSLNICMTV